MSYTLKMSQGFWHVTHTAAGHSAESYGRFKYVQDATDAIEKVQDLENTFRATPQRVFDNQLAVYSALALTELAGFDDTTNGDDACSSVGLTVELGQENSGSVLDLRLWIDWADDQRRESDGPMFAVTISRDSCGIAEEFYVGDDIEDAVEVALNVALPELRRQQELKTFTVGLTFYSEGFNTNGYKVVEVVADKPSNAIWQAQATAANEHAKREGLTNWAHDREASTDTLADTLHFNSAMIVGHGPFHGQMVGTMENLRTIEIWTAGEQL